MIYFLTNKKSKETKIGITTNINQRIKQLEKECRTKLVLELLIEGGRKEEIELHYFFDKDKIFGEWFKRSKNIIKYINDNSAKNIQESELLKPICYHSLKKRKEILSLSIKTGFLNVNDEYSILKDFTEVEKIILDIKSDIVKFLGFKRPKRRGVQAKSKIRKLKNELLPIISRKLENSKKEIGPKNRNNKI